MKFPRRLPHFRSLKFAPFALLALFVFSNVTGFLFSHALAPAAAANEHSFNIPADIPTSGDPALDRIIFEVGEKQGVDPRFIHAVIWQESKYKVDARSHAGAQGLMQLIPATAKRFGCEHPEDPKENVTAGTKYLGWLLKRFSGNVELALAAYNAGEGKVDEWYREASARGEKFKVATHIPFAETRNYVSRVLDVRERYRREYRKELGL